MQGGAVQAREAMARYFERRGIKPENESLDDWLHENWAYMTFFGHRVPVKPLYGYKKVLVVHDMHHLATGYDTTWTGEFEVAAWELGSGGCGRFVLMWINRMFTLFLGWIFARSEIRHAYERGQHERNLYERDCEELLRSDLDELKQWITRPSSA